MDRRLWIAAVWSLAIACAAALAGLGAYVWSGEKLWLLPVMMLAVGIAGFTPIHGYSARIPREAGFAKPSPQILNPATALIGALFVATVGLEWLVFATTKSRLAECVVAVAVVVSAGIPAARCMYASLPAPKPQDAWGLQLSMIVQPASGLVCAASALLASLARHDYGFGVLKDTSFAMAWFTLPFSFIVGFFMNRRYREARLASEPRPLFDCAPFGRSAQSDGDLG